jgi:hypothetical protein
MPSIQNEDQPKVILGKIVSDYYCPENGVEVVTSKILKYTTREEFINKQLETSLSDADGGHHALIEVDINGNIIK